MKIRSGFVANSSSSSFLIPYIALTDLQIHQIRYHVETAIQMGMTNVGYTDEGTSWNIWVVKNYIKAYTTMDNFDMFQFLINIGVDPKYVKREE